MFLPIKVKFNPAHKLSELEEGLVKAAIFNHYILLQHRRMFVRSAKAINEAHGLAQCALARDGENILDSKEAKAVEAELEEVVAADWLDACLSTFVAETFGAIVLSCDHLPDPERRSYHCFP